MMVIIHRMPILAIINLLILWEIFRKEITFIIFFLFCYAMKISFRFSFGFTSRLFTYAALAQVQSRMFHLIVWETFTIY
jgi:hypothetical protein